MYITLYFDFHLALEFSIGIFMWIAKPGTIFVVSTGLYGLYGHQELPINQSITGYGCAICYRVVCRFAIYFEISVS